MVAKARVGCRVPSACVVARVVGSRGRARVRWSLLLIILSVTIAGTGCGSSDNGVASKSAAEILTVARSAAQSASSVHLTTRSKIGKAKVTVDASLTKEQGHARTLALGTAFEAVRVDNTFYVKGNRAFDAQLERVLGAEVPHGVWLKGSDSGPLAQVGSIVNMTIELPIILGGQGTVTKGSAAKVNGQPAIELKQEHKLYTATLYVATTGQPYPLKITKVGQETGQTTFTGWNDPVTVSAPANAVDISTLQHSKGH
jgi:hypothetical protein